jgi:hypothetical protein
MRQNGQDGDGPTWDWIGRNEYLALIEHLAVTLSFHRAPGKQAAKETI